MPMSGSSNRAGSEQNKAYCALSNSCGLPTAYGLAEVGYGDFGLHRLVPLYRPQRNGEGGRLGGMPSLHADPIDSTAASVPET